MRELVRAFDERVDAAFDHLRGNEAADRLFYGASALGDFGLIWVIFAAVRGLRGGRINQRAAIRAIVCTGLESVLVNLGLKSLFRRGRPRHHDPRPHSLRIPITSSFPSGHATAAFCAATLLSEGDELAPLYFAAATVVAASRVHVKIHHPSDVVGGIGVGLVLGLIGRRLYPLAGPKASMAVGDLATGTPLYDEPFTKRRQQT
ncbi:MAG TPA: phosphatase PAP2 family protein [Acidimicrobiales bacterium]|nr:phosphatase PAP2 family protein [Acidimicrobiales bacterium]